MYRSIQVKTVGISHLCTCTCIIAGTSRQESYRVRWAYFFAILQLICATFGIVFNSVGQSKEDEVHDTCSDYHYYEYSLFQSYFGIWNAVIVSVETQYIYLCIF